jgi:hypothetical protein
VESTADGALLRKKNFQLPAGIRLRILAAVTGLGALAVGAAVAAALINTTTAMGIALFYGFCSFIFMRVSHSEIRADDRGIQTAMRQAFRPRRIPWKDIDYFDVTECAGGELIVVARLQDGNDVVLPELKSEYPWAWRWGRNAGAVTAVCDELNRRRHLEVRMFRVTADYRPARREVAPAQPTPAA